MIITNLLIMMNIMLMLISQEFFQVLSNLINNALSLQIGGVISISLDKAKSPSSDKNNSLEENEYTLIRIKDNGRGIDPDVQSRLFSKFATKSILGQALDYLSQGVLSKLIWAGNNSDGKGATFSFTF